MSVRKLHKWKSLKSSSNNEYECLFCRLKKRVEFKFDPNTGKRYPIPTTTYYNTGNQVEITLPHCYDNQSELNFNF